VTRPRTRIPFIQSRSSGPLMAASIVIMVTGIVLPFTRLGAYLGFSPLPGLYWPLLALTLAGYVILTQGVKVRLRRHGWI